MPGIGQATAVSFAKDGCKKIVIADRNTNGLSETASLIRQAVSDCDVLVQQTDISSEQSVQSLIETAVEKFGRIDYACNSAGTGSSRQVSREAPMLRYTYRHAE